MLLGTTNKGGTVTESKTEATTSTVTNKDGSTTEKQETTTTSDGVKSGEVDPKTMASKKAEGLFFAGELLDCDAYTGGFNLQIAWATAFAAGNAAAEKIKH